MRLIAHRGNTNGPDSKENHPDYLRAALESGFDVEADVQYVESKFFLGHEKPNYEIDKCFLFNKRIWTHAKTVETFFELVKYKDVNVFFHNDDEVVLTSQGFVWSHPKNGVFNSHTVHVCTGYDEKAFLSTFSGLFGLCSDYVEKYRALQSKLGAAEERSGMPFKLLVIDIDGVMTDGTKHYDLNAKVSGKRYSDLDFTAIKRFKAAGVKVCFLSGDENVNVKMAESRKIDFQFARCPSGNIDKSLFLPLLAERYHVAVDDIAYVGDDYYDLTIIENLKFTFCPSTAISCVKERVLKVLPCPGGYGVIASLYDEYRGLLDYSYPFDSLEENPR